MSDRFVCLGKRDKPAICKDCYYKMRAANEDIKLRKKEYSKRLDVKERANESKKKYRQSQKGIKCERDYRNNPEMKERAKAYQLKHSQKAEYKKRKLAYRRTPEVKERAKVARIERIRNIEPLYVKTLIYNRMKGSLRFNEIPPELIELQRQSLILKRTIKQKNKENE